MVGDDGDVDPVGDLPHPYVAAFTANDGEAGPLEGFNYPAS